MRTIHAANELKPGARKVCLAIGVFDGVHLGHQQIIRQTITDARQHNALSLVITFDRHPNAVVAPARVPPQIYSLPQKLRAIKALGTDAVLLIHFDKAFSRKPAETFIRDLARDLGSIQSLCVGADFTFGYKRSGDVPLLKRMGAQLNFLVRGMGAVSLDGKVISSTRIRKAIAAGNLDAASQMLGRAYSVSGAILRGDGLGRQLGFPTANIDASALVLPPHGVYAVEAETGGHKYQAVLNIGLRPTLRNPNPELRVEAHLFDFNSDIYGQELEVTFVDRLREEKKFASLEELRTQIALDAAEARRRF
jgi:riboflavin kinase / FMN adenylyltransferase